MSVNVVVDCAIVLPRLLTPTVSYQIKYTMHIVHLLDFLNSLNFCTASNNQTVENHKIKI